MALAEGQVFSGDHPVAISPDGAQIAFIANQRLWLRSMGDLEARAVVGDGTNPVTTPVFSPDGQSLAFISYSDRTLKRIGVNGGAALTVCPATTVYGVSWTNDGIFFGQDPGGILRVAPNGGTPEVVVRVEDGEIAAHPWLLPGGVMLYTLARGGDWDRARIVAQSLASGERRVVIDGGSDAKYLSTGHLVYAVSGALFAVRFDPDRLMTVGAASPVVEGIGRGAATGAAEFAVSNTGSIVHLPGTAGNVERRLAMVDRTGQVVPLKVPPGRHSVPRLSPDGTRVVFQADEGKDASIWIYDMSGTTQPRRLTLGGRNRFPAWSPDGRRVTFQSDREGDAGIFWQLADGTGPVERLTKPEPGTSHIPDAWSPSGETLVFEAAKDGRNSLWSLALRDKKIERVGEFEHDEAIDAVFSPDGRWIAYDSPEAGGTNVFVRRFPADAARYQVTKVAGARNPFWWRDGQVLKLVYSVGPAAPFEAVALTMQPSFGVGPSVPLPRGGLRASSPQAVRNYDQVPTEKRIIGVIANQTFESVLHVTLNWTEELKRLVPAN